MSQNNFHFTGTVGYVDPAPRAAGSTMVFKFTVAVNQNYKKNEQWVNNTMWVTVNVWGQEAAAYYQKRIVKGARVSINGSLEFDTATGSPKMFTNDKNVTRTQFAVTPDVRGGIEILYDPNAAAKDSQQPTGTHQQAQAAPAPRQQPAAQPVQQKPAQPVQQPVQTVPTVTHDFDIDDDIPF